MLSNYKFFNFFILFIFFGVLVYFLLDGLVFEFLFKSGLEPILKFIFTGNEHAILPQIKLADTNFFFIYVANFFVFLGIYLIYQNNKVIFSNNYYFSDKENLFVKLKKKRNISKHSSSCWV